MDEEKLEDQQAGDAQKEVEIGIGSSDEEVAKKDSSKKESKEESVEFNKQPLFDSERSKENMQHTYSFEDQDLLKFSQSLKDKFYSRKE